MLSFPVTKLLWPPLTFQAMNFQNEVSYPSRGLCQYARLRTHVLVGGSLQCLCFIFNQTTFIYFPFSLWSILTLCILLWRLKWLFAIFGMRSTSFAASEGLTYGINPYLVKDLGCHWLSDFSTTNSLPKSYLMPCMKSISLKFHKYGGEQFLLEVANASMPIFCSLLFYALI